MDPSKQQSDNDSDAHSLEGSGTIIEADDKLHTNTSASPEAASPTDATDGEITSEHQRRIPVIKRVWQRFNIYLLLFILIVLIAFALSVLFFFKNRNETKKSAESISSQTLSTDTLKQLANTSVTVGNNKQILNVASNAIFAGSVLVRSDIEVAGTIKIGRDVQVPNLTVTGTSRFSQLQADSLAISDAATIQGVLTAKRGINVSGNSNFDSTLSANQISTNSLQLNGNLVITNHIVAGGPVPNITRGNAVGSGGTASLSGSDTTGSVTINTGGGTGAGCFATITFARKFNSVPHVSLTPVGSGAADLNYYVNRTTSEFSICTTNPAPTGQSFGFDYIVFD